MTKLILTASIVRQFHWLYVSLYIGLFVIDIACLFGHLYCLPKSWNPLGSKDVALVTGGLSGLGLEVVKQLFHEYNVGHIYILDTVEPSFNFNSPRVEFHRCDLRLSALVRVITDLIIKDLHSRGLRISLVVNNAGIRNNGLLLNIDEDKLRSAFEVNTFAQVTILRRVINHHLEFHSKCQLYIVSVSSILATLAPKNLSVYSASKAAAYQFHEALTQELKQHSSIRLLLVATGQLTTNMFKDISPSRLFFAPLVDHRSLAGKILKRAIQGKEGVLCDPIYANFLPMVKVFPVFVQQLCRWFSQMDEKLPDQ